MLFHETHAKTHKRGTTKWLARHSNNNYLKTIFSCPKVLNINMKWHCGNSSLSGSISARYTDFKKRWLEFSELVVIAGKIPQKIPSQAAPLPARTTRWSCACQISFHWALGNIIFVNGATELWATPSVTQDLYLYWSTSSNKAPFAYGCPGFVYTLKGGSVKTSSLHNHNPKCTEGEILFGKIIDLPLGQTTH